MDNSNPGRAKRRDPAILRALIEHRKDQVVQIRRRSPLSPEEEELLQAGRDAFRHILEEHGELVFLLPDHPEQE